MGAEGAIAITDGILASSIALVAFGLDRGDRRPESVMARPLPLPQPFIRAPKDGSIES